jgi:hypothetical protein
MNYNLDLGQIRGSFKSEEIKLISGIDRANRWLEATALTVCAAICNRWSHFDIVEGRCWGLPRRLSSKLLGDKSIREKI